MLHIIASYRYGGKIIALRVYSDIDRGFKDVGMDIIAKMIDNNVITLTNTELTRIAMLSIKVGDIYLNKESKCIYSDAYVRNIMKTVNDNIEVECGCGVIKERCKALVGVDGESAKIGNEQISVIKAVSYKGEEVTTILERGRTDVVYRDNREDIIRMGFDPFYYIAATVNCREVSGEVNLSNTISRVIQKENVLGTNTLEAVQLMGEVILIRYSDENVEELSVPDGITMVKSGAFYNCKRLSRIDYNEKVKYLSHNAFRGTPLREYTLKPSIETFVYKRYDGRNEAKINVAQGVARNIKIM